MMYIFRVASIILLMQKSIFSREQVILQDLLRQIRTEAGRRQADLAERLSKPQPFVSRFEKGEKLLDLPELRQICHALEISLPKFVTRYENALQDYDLANPLNVESNVRSEIDIKNR